MRPRLASRVVGKVVSVDLVRGSAIGAARVFELADQFLFLRIYAEDRITGREKLLTLLSQVLELAIAIRMRRSPEPFEVHSQREAPFREQPPHGFRRVLHPPAELTQTQPHELSSPDRRAARHRLDQLGQSLFEARLFFSTAGRPPPRHPARSN